MLKNGELSREIVEITDVQTSEFLGQRLFALGVAVRGPLLAATSNCRVEMSRHPQPAEPQRPQRAWVWFAKWNSLSLACLCVKNSGS